MKELSKSVDPTPQPQEEPQKPQGPKQSIVQETVEKQETPDRPLSAEYFSLEGWGPLLLEPKLDVYGLKDKIVFIEDFLSDRLSKQNMKVDRDTVRGVLKDVEDVLRITDKHETHHRVKRVYDFLWQIKDSDDRAEEKKRWLKMVLKKV